LGVIITHPNTIAALDFPDSISELCAAHPSGKSIDMTEPGRRKRNDLNLLGSSEVKERYATSKMQHVNHNRNQLH
jgi:hypothetical protein